VNAIGVRMGFAWAILDASVQYIPLKALENTNFECMGLSIDPYFHRFADRERII
tara:strand:+ start:610 stop:771 length:162 start_codon:yes stop_codon:yes gene_type:complete